MLIVLACSLIGAMSVSVLQAVFIAWADFVFKTDVWYYQILIFILALVCVFLIFSMFFFLFGYVSMAFSYEIDEEDDLPFMNKLGMWAIGIVIFGILTGCTTFVVLYIIKTSKTRDVVMMGIEVISVMISSAISAWSKDGFGLFRIQPHIRLNHSY